MRDSESSTTILGRLYHQTETHQQDKTDLKKERKMEQEKQRVSVCVCVCEEECVSMSVCEKAREGNGRKEMRQEKCILGN